MIYVCCSCHKMFDHTEFESKTKKIIPQYFIPFGELGWLHSTYICPNPKCKYENAGYDLKTEEEFVGLKTYRIQWINGEVKELIGMDIKNAIVRAGYDVAELINVKKFGEINQ